MQGELQQIRDSSLHQRRRMNEMLFSLLSDLGEVGHVVGGTASDLSLKVLLDIVCDKMLSLKL